MQTWAWGAGAAAIVLLLLLAMRGRSGKPSGKQPASSLADRFGAVPPIGSESDDPDQDELLDQLAENPDDISLHLELVSLYYHRRDVEHFEAAAEAMYAHITDPQQSEWQDVAAMGEDLVPGHPLFAGVDTSVPEDERAPLGGFSLDDAEEGDGDAYTPAAPVPPPAAAGPSKISEYHFDFNLTPPPLTQSGEPEVADAHEPDDDDRTVMRDIEPAAAEPVTSSWNFEEPVNDTTAAAAQPLESGSFSDDPIDTKLDLARAYMDMGDADGARAMLDEVLNEGTQMQKDAAQRLIESLG
jgi:pilus assembly protein FimV